MFEHLKKQKWEPLGIHTLYREMFKEHLERQKKLQEKRRPVGWFWACFPAELAYVFDIINIFPEQYCAYCAAKLRSTLLIDSAIEKGYGTFMCDYFKCSVGSILNPEAALLMGHCGARPNFIFDSRMCCYGHHAMSEVYSQLYGKSVKRFVLDTPFWTKEKVGQIDQLTKIPEKIDKEYFDYVISQIEDYIGFLEKITGDKLDREKMDKVFEISEKTSRNFIQVAELMYSKPTPMSQLEYRDFPAPGFYLAGADYALEFSEKVLEKMEERVKSGEGIVKEERLRLMTHGIVPWYSDLYREYEERGIVFPINPYVEGTFCYIDASRPFESMVRRSIIYTNSEVEVWIESLIKRARQAKIDGAILFENTGCRPIALCLRRLKETLWDELGLPSVIVEAPQCDPRNMPMERTLGKINAFIESIL
jgi:benzoyl-CoA reductase/2-hydroxyglutaryl-CoA dehydratase subunit BcrC/BadD/HgdB